MNSKLYTVALSILVGCTLSGPTPDDLAASFDEDGGVREQGFALNSHITFSSRCTSRQRQRVEEAAEIALRQVNGTQRGAMLTCLKEAYLSMDEDGFPERLLAQLREDKTTTVHCEQEADGTQGHARVGISHEEIHLDYDFLNEACSVTSCAPGVSDVERIASIFLHEIVHNKGYSHPENIGGTQEYRYTVPEQVEQCSLAISSGQTKSFPRGVAHRPNGAMRSEAVGRVELAPVGSHGGSPFGLDSCASGSFARGLGVRAGSKIDRVWLRCATPSSTAISTTPGRGGSGGTIRVLDCPSNSFLVGVAGRAADELDAIAPICATTSQISARSTSTSKGSQVGGSGGYEFERLCPVGMALKAIGGRSAGRVDQLSMVCQDIGNTKTPTITWSAEYGSRSGEVHHERCATGAVVALFGQSARVIDRVGAECQELTRNSLGRLARSGSAQVAAQVALTGQGGTGGTNWSPDACPAGQALVGMLINHADKIDRIRGVCADVDAWDRGVATTQNYLANHGGSGGLASSAGCPSGAFVSGWEISHSGTVRSMRLMCHRF